MSLVSTRPLVRALGALLTAAVASAITACHAAPTTPPTPASPSAAPSSPAAGHDPTRCPSPAIAPDGSLKRTSKRRNVPDEEALTRRRDAGASTPAPAASSNEPPCSSDTSPPSR